MTARQQSLTAKLPCYAALFFTGEDTAGIAPSSNILNGRLENGSEVNARWDGEEFTAVIIALSNSRADLEDAMNSFVPPSVTKSKESESVLIEQGTSNSTEPASSTKTNKNNKKKEQKPAATTLSSGRPASESTPTDPVPEAAFNVDQVVQSLVDGDNGASFTRATQVEILTVNNTTQTEKDWCVQLFDKLFDRIDQLETKLVGKLDTMEKRLCSLENVSQPSSVGAAVSEASSVLRDPYDFSQTDSVPTTPTLVPTTPTIFSTPTSGRSSYIPRSCQREMYEPGYGKPSAH